MLALLLSVSASVASAQSDAEIERARVLFEEGTALYAEGRYEESARRFEAAYELAPLPEFLYNVYTASERAGHVERALEALRAYLSEAGEVPNRDALESRIRILEQRLRDEEAAQAAIEAERRALETRAEQAEAARREAEEAAAAAGPTMDAGEIAAYSTASGMALGFGILAILAAREDADLADRCGRDAGRWCRDQETRRLRGLSIAADASLGMTLVSGATGVMLTLLRTQRESDDETAIVVSPTVVRGGALLTAQGSF